MCPFTKREELIERVDGDVNAVQFFSQFTLHVLGNVILLFGILGTV